MKVTVKGIWSTRRIFVNGKELKPGRSQKAYNHSPDGFNWGYGGSGPAQLALALLMLVYLSDKAISMHQDFKWKHIATLPQGDFEVEMEL